MKRGVMRYCHRTAACVVVLCSVWVGAGSATAHERVGHTKPAAAAARHFPAGFRVPVDSEWKPWKLGGFGGPRSLRSRHLPVVLVHGNNTDHATWFPVADQMTRALGWGPGDLWALSYNGVGCTNDGAIFTLNSGYRRWTYQEDRARSDGCRITGNTQNVPDLAAFIRAVLRYTGAKRLHIVAHSLGVTVARRTLWEHPDLYGKVAGFVAIAGANHGTTVCRNGETTLESCDEIAPGSPWLAKMNDGAKGRRPGKPGSNEAPRPTRWITVYDGTGAGDPLFIGPDSDSPALAGALNCEFPGFYHNDLRVDRRIVRFYAGFLSATERGADYTCPVPPPPGPP